MARKTTEERLLETENQLKKLKAQMKKEQLKFRRKTADDLLKVAEEATGVTITVENVDIELKKMKEKISGQVQTPQTAESEEELKAIKDLIDFISNVLGHSVTTSDILKTKEFLSTQEERGNWYSNFMNR